MSKEEIARVKAEWEAKEARRKAKEKAEEKDKSGKGGGGKNASTEGGEDEMKNGSKSPSPTVPGALSSPSGAATPTHKRYSLHRDFYAMRQAEHRRKNQAKQMQELAPRLPGAPHGSLMG